MGYIPTYTTIVIILHLLVLCVTTVPERTKASDPGPLSIVPPGLCCNEAAFRFLDPENQGDHSGFKSKTRARMYSTAATTIPVALARLNARGFHPSEQSGTSLLLLASGMIAGPSAGSFYADDWNLAQRSMLIRSSGASVLVAGYYMRDYEDIESLGSGMMLSGAAFLVSHALYDIFFLSAHSVDYYNAKVKLQAGLSHSDLLPHAWLQTYPADAPRNSIWLIPTMSISLSF